MLENEAIAQAKQAIQHVPFGDTGLALADVASIFVKSGYFRDVKEQAQALVKMMLGAELGLKPLQAMMGIHIVEGKPEISAALMAALVKRSGRYDYSVKHHDDEGCAITFYAIKGEQRVEIGVSEFTMHDAQRAGLAGRGNWKSYPRNMTFARCMSNGVKWYCGDAVGGLPIYTDGEISDAVNGARPAQDKAPAEIADSRPLSAPQDDDNPYAPRQIESQQAQERSLAPTPGELSAGSAPPQPGTGSTKKDAKPRGRAATMDKPREGLEPAEQGGTPGEGSVVETGPRSASSPVSSTEGAAPPAPSGRVVFTIGGSTYDTAGMNREQMAESFDLVVKADKRIGKGYARSVLAKILGCPPAEASRNNATEAQAETWLNALRQAIAEEKK